MDDTEYDSDHESYYNFSSIVSNSYRLKYPEFTQLIDNNIESLNILDDIGKSPVEYVRYIPEARERVLYMVKKGADIRSKELLLDFIFGVRNFRKINFMNSYKSFRILLLFLYNFPVTYTDIIDTHISGLPSSHILSEYSYEMICMIRMLLSIKNGELGYQVNATKDFISTCKRFSPSQIRIYSRERDTGYYRYFSESNKDRQDMLLIFLEYCAEFFISRGDLEYHKCLYLFYELKSHIVKLNSVFKHFDHRFLDISKLYKNLEIIKGFLLDNNKCSENIKKIINKL